MLSMNVFKKVKNFGKNKNCVEFETMTLGKLLTQDFINTFTEFSDFDQMIDVSGIKTINNSFTDVFISREWDEFVNYTTDFSGWKEMIERAVENYISNE